VTDIPTPPARSEEPTLLERADFPVYMLLAAINDPFRITGSHDGLGYVQVGIVHTLEGGRRVDVNTSNAEISGLPFARDPREKRAMAALRF
jgi:hypothetical protein